MLHRILVAIDAVNAPSARYTRRAISPSKAWMLGGPPTANIDFNQLAADTDRQHRFRGVLTEEREPMRLADLLGPIVVQHLGRPLVMSVVMRARGLRCWPAW
jgi:hypothetical protein